MAGILTITYLEEILDCWYRVVKSSSLVSVLFREAFSHLNISFFHVLNHTLDMRKNNFQSKI